MERKNNIAPVVLSQYDPTWVDEYGKEKDVIVNLIGNQIILIEHIGSTSVPNMVAKPELDILIGVENIANISPLIPILENEGYLYYQRFEEFVPERRYFRKSQGIIPLVHIHIVESSSTFFKEHIVFRNELRSDAELRARYARLKYKLVEDGGGDRMKYDKEDFMKTELNRLRKEGKL